MKTTEIKWHVIREDGTPEFKKGETQPRQFLVAVPMYAMGKFYPLTTVALMSPTEKKEGFAYTPKGKFYWGPNIFENAVAWAEYPEYELTEDDVASLNIDAKELENAELMQRLKYSFTDNPRRVAEEPPLPEVGKRYIAYSDGKCRPSRAFVVEVTKIQRLSECSEETKKEWEIEAEKHKWLGYDQFANPHVVFAETVGETTQTTSIFIPSVHTDYRSGNFSVQYPTPIGKRKPFWFSMGWYAALLDLDGSISQSIVENKEDIWTTEAITEMEKLIKELNQTK